MGIIVVAFAAGILACQLGVALPSPLEMGSALGVGLVTGALAWRRLFRRAASFLGLLLAIAGAAIGWSYAGWRAELQLATRAAANWKAATCR